MDAIRIAGGCLCGAVRYASEAEPVVSLVCHCPHCQKQTSSAFSMLVAVPMGTLRLEGRDLAAFEDVGESGQPVTAGSARNAARPSFPTWRRRRT